MIDENEHKPFYLSRARYRIEQHDSAVRAYLITLAAIVFLLLFATACDLSNLKLPELEVSVRDGNAEADETAPPKTPEDGARPASPPVVPSAKTVPLEDFHAIVGTLTYFTVRCTKDDVVDEACIDKALECVAKTVQPRSKGAGEAVRRCGSEAAK